MRYCVLFFVLLLSSFPVIAQEEYHNYGQAYGFDAGQQAYIFADTANVRTEANINAPVQDRLLQGTVIKIEKTGAVYELNGKSAPWCTISYELNGTVKKGVIWAGLLSPRMLRRGDTRFLYGMKFPGNDTVGTIVDIKALRNDSLIARTSFTIASIESAGGAHNAKIDAAKGLGGLQYLLYFYYSGEACAIPTYEQYIGWNGKQFIRLPLLTSSGDAGVYGETEHFIFPSDKGGTAGLLIYKYHLESYDENDKPVHKSDKTTRYKWDAVNTRLIKL